MLRVKQIPEILDAVTTDGALLSILMTVDGALLGVSSQDQEKIAVKDKVKR
ncbi:MAG: hypothetical protein AAF388_30000 [Bacteroidota bacterium]